MNEFLKPWEADYFRKRFGTDATAAVFALPMRDGTVMTGKRQPNGSCTRVVEVHRSMPVALAALRKAHPAAVPVWTRGQYWAVLS